jgi:SanA protein
MQRLKRLIILATKIFVGLVLGINIVVGISSKPFIYEDTASAPLAQAVLIPGAAILPSGAPTQFFLDRVDTGLELYKAGKVSKILVSGDNSTETHNEVNPVRLYLIEHGVPDQDIFLDHAGFDTYSSMYRARDIFGVESIIISTQSFHLPRAVFIARILGIKSYGVRSDGVTPYFRNYIREMLANEKAIMNLILHTRPKFLGDPIPITGDGRESL